MRSATERAEVVSGYLKEECASGRVLGLFRKELLGTALMINRIGVIPKGFTGKWRLIVDLSFPEGNSINDGIDPNICSLHYTRVEDTARELVRQGRGSFMVKVDIRSAYWTVPVNPQDWWLLGMQWEDSLFMDTTLPFGLRSAPKIFRALADVAEWIIKQRGVYFCLHYLEDFLMIGPDRETCATDMQVVLETFGELGLPVTANKLEGLCSHLTFLGLELDSVALEMRLPQDKLSELQQLFSLWSGRRSCRKKELESSVGKLSQANRVI